MFSATTFDKCLLELNFNKPNYFCFSWTILILCTVSPSKPQNQANADLLLLKRGGEESNVFPRYPNHPRSVSFAIWMFLWFMEYCKNQICKHPPVSSPWEKPQSIMSCQPPPPLWLSRTLGSLCKRMPAIDIFRHAKHLGWCPAAFVGFSVLGQQTADLTRVVDNVWLSFCVTIDLWGIFSRCLTPLPGDLFDCYSWHRQFSMFHTPKETLL